MKKLLSKIFKDPPKKKQTQDEIALLIQRLCDPTDILYDEEFAKGFEKK